MEEVEFKNLTMVDILTQIVVNISVTPGSHETKTGHCLTPAVSAHLKKGPVIASERRPQGDKV